MEQPNHSLNYSLTLNKERIELIGKLKTINSRIEQRENCLNQSSLSNTKSSKIERKKEQKEELFEDREDNYEKELNNIKKRKERDISDTNQLYEKKIEKIKLKIQQLNDEIDLLEENQIKDIRLVEDKHDNYYSELSTRYSKFKRNRDKELEQINETIENIISVDYSKDKIWVNLCFERDSIKENIEQLNNKVSAQVEIEKQLEQQRRDTNKYNSEKEIKEAEERYKADLRSQQQQNKLREEAEEKERKKRVEENKRKYPNDYLSYEEKQEQLKQAKKLEEEDKSKIRKKLQTFLSINDRQTKYNIVLKRNDLFQEYREIYHKDPEKILEMKGKFLDNLNLENLLEK